MGEPIKVQVGDQIAYPCWTRCQGKQRNAEHWKTIQANFAEHAAHSDHLQIAAQGICPVSGEKLGSMGEPIKVKVGEEEVVFLCCKGCIGKPLNAEHWATVQSNLAKAQGTCLVMDKPVDGNRKSTVVNGRKIFVYCPPCIEKLQANPGAYLAKLDLQIATNAPTADSN